MNVGNAMAARALVAQVQRRLTALGALTSGVTLDLGPRRGGPPDNNAVLTYLVARYPSLLNGLGNAVRDVLARGELPTPSRLRSAVAQILAVRVRANHVKTGQLADALERVAAGGGS